MAENVTMEVKVTVSGMHEYDVHCERDFVDRMVRQMFKGYGDNVSVCITTKKEA